MIWYTGEAGATPARATALARVDPSTTVAYGMRANEQALSNIVANVAVLAATSYSPSDPNAAASYAALTQRVTANLNGPPGTQTLSDIESDSRQRADDDEQRQERNQQTQNTLTDMLQQIEGVSTERGRQRRSWPCRRACRRRCRPPRMLSQAQPGQLPARLARGSAALPRAT